MAEGRMPDVARWLLVAIALVAIALAACDSGDDSEPSPTPSTTTTATPTAPSSTEPSITQTLSTTPTTATEGAVPSDPMVSPSASSGTNIVGEPSCPDRNNNHVNVDMLRQHLNLPGAAVSEIDLDTVRVTVGNTYFDLIGWGHDTTVAGPAALSGDEFEAVISAFDAANFQC